MVYMCSKCCQDYDDDSYNCSVLLMRNTSVCSD